MHAVYHIKLTFLLVFEATHVLYEEMRTAVMGEQLLSKQKPRLNVVDQYAMAVKMEGFLRHRWPFSSQNCGTRQGSEIANSHSYRPLTIFFRSSQTK